MLHEDLTTLQLVWRESSEIFHSRNPFPIGGIIEHPVTGAAAAALGGYLRNAKLIEVPATFLFAKERRWVAESTYSGYSCYRWNYSKRHSSPN